MQGMAVMLKGKNKRRFQKVINPFVVSMQRLRYREILVLGDSHVNVFRDGRFKTEFPDFFFNIVRVGGATTSGLKNPKSGTRSLTIFRKSLKRTTAETVIMLIGEVDAGFVIWYRAKKYNDSVDAMFTQAVENYQNFLAEVSKTKQVICISVPLPTIEDNNDWGEVANLRNEVDATQKERTDLTLRFNEKLEKFCGNTGVHFLSLDKESLGENGLVSRLLLNDDRNDHHYDREKYAEMIIGRLKKYIGSTLLM